MGNIVHKIRKDEDSIFASKSELPLQILKLLKQWKRKYSSDSTLNLSDM